MYFRPFGHLWDDFQTIQEEEVFYFGLSCGLLIFIFFNFPYKRQEKCLL